MDAQIEKMVSNFEQEVVRRAIVHAIDVLKEDVKPAVSYPTITIPGRRVEVHVLGTPTLNKGDMVIEVLRESGKPMSARAIYRKVGKFGPRSMGSLGAFLSNFKAMGMVTHHERKWAIA